MRWFKKQKPVQVAPEGTLIGTDDGFRAIVDDQGTVFPLGADHGVQWWVRYGDDWHQPNGETRQRQTRPGTAPILETTMHIPDGRVIATTWAAAATGPGVITEIRNESAAPIAIAVSPEPAPWSTSPQGKSGVVTVVHGSGMRFVVPGPGAEKAKPEDFPEAERVKAGWDKRFEEIADTQLPGTDLGGFKTQQLVDLFLAEPTPDGACSLSAWGLPTEATRQIAEAAPSPEWLNAAVEHWARHRNLADFTEPRRIDLDQLLRSAGRRTAPTDPQSLANLLAALGEHQAATDLQKQKPAQDVWPRRYGALVEETSKGLALFPDEFSADWYGKDLAVTGLATQWGQFGFALRWHGARPALLWELNPHPETSAVITTPGLDTSFESNKNEGETLLAEPPKVRAVGTVPTARTLSEGKG